MIPLDAFLELDTDSVAKAVCAKKSPVCAFPINGTRRWFKLEHPHLFNNGLGYDYFQIMLGEHQRVFKLLFDHGIQTVLSPMVGPDIFKRGSSYQKIILPGLLWFAESEESVSFFVENQIRVKLYGDIECCFQGDVYRRLKQAYNKLEEKTAVFDGPLLLIGLCANDPAENVAQIGVEYFQNHQKLPDKKAIIEAYYGEYIHPVDFFIGFDRLSAFDMPLLATGQEDLYFMVAPSLYIDQQLIRTILFDHLFSRTVSEKYASHQSEGDFMKQFYELNRHSVIGIGRRSKDGSFWYPIPQVKLPSK